MNLNGKSILFISPSFFGYEEAIKKYLGDLGAEICFFLFYQRLDSVV